MKKNKKIGMYVADFETTVYDGQTSTEVWASALVKLDSENVILGKSIKEFFNTILHLDNDHTIIYFHNLKFDGSFILDYLLNNSKYQQAIKDGKLLSGKDFYRYYVKGKRTFTYLVSEMGQWYNIIINNYGKIIEIRDSLKLLPLSVKAIGKSFNTKHQKLDMEYEGIRYAGYTPTKEEAEYIKNDVLVVKEALEMFLIEGHDKTTIGSCCLSEFKEKSFHDKTEFKKIFPDLSQITFHTPLGNVDADTYIRASYHGGFCYVKPDKANKIQSNGYTVDYNSLYPSVMHSKSGCRYPYGMPEYFVGNIPEQALSKNIYYFVRFRCRFNLKKNHLPTLQIKNSVYYKSNEWLSTSDYIDSRGKRFKSVCGEEMKPLITMTCTDFEIFKKHYDIKELEIIDGCMFRSCIGLFDNYIDKYMAIKQTSKDGKRMIAKLFLNNLYGRLSTSSDSSYKVYEIKDGVLKSHIVNENDKGVVYIACGSAITSYARKFCITPAQLNYDNFCYADTDSLHCTGTPDMCQGVEIHESALCCVKVENRWDKAIFVRQKTYIEHNVMADEHECIPHYMIKCAGMGKGAKNELNTLLENNTYTLVDFKRGLEIDGNLKARIIKGGTLLTKQCYKMK